jgi:tRNA dimethylallyltransferase
MTPAAVPPDSSLRDELSRLNLAELQEKLKIIDSERYAEIDIKNPRRLIRAIEIARAPKVEPLGIPKVQPLYDVLWIGLTLPLPLLKQRIHDRLFARLDAGMLDEARQLNSAGLTWERMEDLGLEYRYIARHLQGKISYDDMLVELEKEIVSYAKRQMTWFKKNKEIVWFKPEEKGKAIELAEGFIEV